MNKFLATVSMVAIVAAMAIPASAADVNGGSAKDTSFGPMAFAEGGTVNWSGFYVGVQGGYGNANHNLTVSEYFEDFCTPGLVAPANYNPFTDSYGHFTPDAIRAVEAFKEGQTGYLESCEKRTVAATPPTTAATGWRTVGGESREIGSIDGLNSSGFIGGGRVGYDHAVGRFLVGLYGEYNFSSMETTANIAGVGSFDITKEDEWSVGGRVGYIVAPRTLAYILAAYTQTEYSVGGLDNPAVSATFDKRSGGSTFDGITVGGGVEFALAANVFLGLEYQHTFYGEEKLLDLYNTAANVGISANDDLDEDKVMGTLKIKLNGFGQ